MICATASRDSRPRFSSNTTNLPALSTPNRSSCPPAAGVCLPTSLSPRISRFGFLTNVSSKSSSDFICWAFSNGAMVDTSSNAHISISSISDVPPTCRRRAT